MKKSIFFVTVLTVCFASCRMNEQDEIFSKNNEMIHEKVSLLDEIYSKEPDAGPLRPFAKALYSAMEESPMLREIIKMKALERFNKEYDVLYQFIMNERIENGLCVRDLLLKYFESEEALAAIEARHPTLTIFVPELPEECFSAKSWNTAEQVPAVAIHPTKQHNIVLISKYGFFDENNDEFVLEAGLIPAFPVVVLKDNARVVVTKNEQSRSEALNNRNSNYVFDFTDDFFDRNKEEKGISQKGLVPTLLLDQKVKDAYEIYNGVDGWQRDYVYYGITPANQKGPYDQNYWESIVYFRLSDKNTPEQALWYITNGPNDPTLKPFVVGSTTLPWTTGNYAFRIFTQVGSTTTYASTIEKLFIASPGELFEVTYKKTPGLAYKVDVTGFKTMILDLKLFKWDLKTCAAVIKITITKENPGTTITKTDTWSSQFAGNFGFDIGFGEDVKIGLKFGATSTTTKGTTFQTQTKLENKSLGDVLVYFEDKIISSKTMYGSTTIAYSIADYESGYYTIALAPTK